MDPLRTLRLCGERRKVFNLNEYRSYYSEPCDAPMLRKIYRPGKPVLWDVVEKETVDEIIFRTTKVRNRLILELMARGGMRVGEV